MMSVKMFRRPSAPSAAIAVGQTNKATRPPSRSDLIDSSLAGKFGGWTKKPSLLKRACNKITKMVGKVMKKMLISRTVGPLQQETVSSSKDLAESHVLISAPLTLQDTIAEQRRRINELFENACRDIDDMTHEQFEAHSVPDELVQLITSYEVNLQLLSGHHVDAAPHSDVDGVCDLSLLFGDADEESLHLDLLFASAGSFEDLHLDILFAQDSPRALPPSAEIKGTGALQRSCSIEALFAMGAPSISQSECHSSVGGLVRIFENMAI